MSVSVAPRPVGDLADRHGGAIRRGAWGLVRHLAPIETAASGDLTILTSPRYIDAAHAAVGRGAMLLVEDSLSERDDVRALPGWFHPHAMFTLCTLLDTADVIETPPVMGVDCRVGPGAVLLPGVRLGNRVTIGAGAVVGAQGFGFATGPDGITRLIPHLAGVVIEDDVHVGPLCTVAAGIFSPTTIHRNVRLDAQVHVGHNCEIGENTVIAAQSGLAGSVVIGKNVMMGGQVGVADHLTVGDGARIAAKSGVIGDVPAGETFAGYPAVARARWLRGLAELYRLASRRTSSLPTPEKPFSVAPRSPSFLRAPVINPAAVIRRVEPGDK